MGCGDRPVGLGRAGMPAGRGTKCQCAPRVPLTGRERTGLQEERWGGGAPLCPQARPVRCVGLDQLLCNEGGATVFMLPGLVTVDVWRVLSLPFWMGMQSVCRSRES